MRVSSPPISEITSSTTTPIRVQRGEVFRGRVLDALGSDRWLLQARGHKWVVESSVPLTKGAWIRAEVIEAGDPIKIRLLPPAAMEPIPEGLAGLLSEIGVPVTLENARLLQMLLRLGLPPLQLPSLLAYLEATPAEWQQGAFLAWLLRLPKYPPLIRTMQTLVQSDVPLGTLLAQLNRALEAYVREHPSASLQALQQQLQGLLEGTDPQTVRRWLDWLVRGYEGRLLRNDRPSEHLKVLLLSLHNALSAREASTLTGLLETAMRLLDAHVLFNQAASEGLPLFYFQIPYPLAGDRGTLTLKGEQGEDSDVWLTFIAHTVHLGKLKIVLHVRDRQVACSLFVENERIRAFVREHTQDLRERLSAMDYQVVSIQERVAPPESFKIELLPTLEDDLTHGVGLDVSV